MWPLVWMIVLGLLVNLSDSISSLPWLILSAKSLSENPYSLLHCIGAACAK